jgi:hypothetical protein
MQGMASDRARGVEQIVAAGAVVVDEDVVRHAENEDGREIVGTRRYPYAVHDGGPCRERGETRQKRGQPSPGARLSSQHSRRAGKRKTLPAHPSYWYWRSSGLSSKPGLCSSGQIDPDLSQSKQPHRQNW